mgnify:CR=1 FL=1
MSVDRTVVVSLPNVAMMSLSCSNKDAQSNMSKRPFVDSEKRKHSDRIPRRTKVPFYTIDRNRVEDTSQMLPVDRNEVIAQSKDAMTSPSRKKTDTSRSSGTLLLPAAMEGKRKDGDKDSTEKAVEPPPKRAKNYFVYRGKVLAPSRDKPDMYDGQAHLHQPTNLKYAMTSEEYEERILCQSKDGRNNTPIPVLQERYNSWKKVMDYMPEIRCIPSETYLLVAITSSGSSDALFPPERYTEAQVICKDKDFVSFLSIKKIILIPRPLNRSYMYYCIPNLHKWVHGSLHTNTCLLYTSDAADDMQCVDLGGRRIIKKVLLR